MRTIKSIDERQQEILDGAMKLFSEKGYDRTSISDIARYLGISQGL
ncbi:helix-turn-helix domain-containing protein [Hathewaya proteolytica]|nr:helix-turn-helix domain-containing protein [Hathewaya proteolytica]